MVRRSFLGLLIVALSGCAAESTATPRASASPGASTGAALGHLELVTDEPVLRPESLDGSPWGLPAAALVTDERIHLWVVTFTDDGDHRGWHLVSGDGTEWETRPDDPFAELGLALADPGPIPTSVVIDADGRWVMYLRGQRTASSPAALWRATSPGADGPWVADPEPVVEPGGGSAWDSLGLDFPSVVRADDGYLMTFGGTDVGSAGSIGLAASTDGVTWTKWDDARTADPPLNESDPVLEPGACGDWDARSLQMGRLLSEPDRLLLVYGGHPAQLDVPMSVGMAESRDGGVTWRCLTESPVLVTEDFPDSFGIHSILAYQAGGTLRLLVESLADGHSSLWLAGPQGG